MVLAPIVLPVYFAKRNLRHGEIREGGTSWNILKNFALFWTLTMSLLAIIGAYAAWQLTSTARTGIEMFGTTMGGFLGLGLLVAVWFFPMLGALVIGFFLKNSSLIEKGPTGNLANQ